MTTIDEVVTPPTSRQITLTVNEPELMMIRMLVGNVISHSAVVRQIAAGIFDPIEKVVEDYDLPDIYCDIELVTMEPAPGQEL